MAHRHRCRVVLVRDTGTIATPASGYDIALVTTDPQATPEQIIANAFVTPRWASCSSTADHHGAVIASPARAPTVATRSTSREPPHTGTHQGG
jgi:hypothetical protein